MPTDLCILLRSPTPPRALRERVWGGAESLSCMTEVATAAPDTPAGGEEPVSPFGGYGCSPCSSPLVAGLADFRCRRLSDASSCATSDSSASYTHNPYSFDGPTYIPSPRSAGSTPRAAFSRLLLPGFYGADLPQGALGSAPQHCRQGESPVFLSAPDPVPLPHPVTSPKRHPSPLSSSTGLDELTVALPWSAGSHETVSPCPSFAGPPASPGCPHPKPWRRLRAKRGLTTYACRDCGVKWRTLSPCRAAALEERDV
eukprot:EG_transcript_6640